MSAMPIEALRLHPDAEKVPLADASDMAALRSSLAENGQQDPVDVTSDNVILDGRTRWTLLRELGAQTIQVRVVDVPDNQQTYYIVDRAVARRHLTMAQKKALNDLLRAMVIEEREPSATSVGRGRTEPLRIGYSQTQRAEKLGVDLNTLQRWDAESAVTPDGVTSPLPTHAIDKRGRPQPIHKESRPSAEVRRERTAARPARPTRPSPPWLRHFTLWCRSVLPEDRPHLVRMSGELHHALELLDITCEAEVDDK